MDNAWAQRGDDIEDADRNEERRLEYAEKCMKACEGLPDGAIDGGWTATGMSAYAARLEQALKPFADHPEFHAPDEWPVTVIDRNEPTGDPVAGVTAGDFRRAKAAMRHNAEVSGGGAFPPSA